MIVLLQSSLNHPALRLAAGIPMALALAGVLIESLELGAALTQSSALLAAGKPEMIGADAEGPASPLTANPGGQSPPNRNARGEHGKEGRWLR